VPLRPAGSPDPAAMEMLNKLNAALHNTADHRGIRLGPLGGVISVLPTRRQAPTPRGGNVKERQPGTIPKTSPASSPPSPRSPTRLPPTPPTTSPGTLKPGPARLAAQ